MTKTALRVGLVVSFLSGWLARPHAAGAADPNLRDADKHFQHGVALYVEADYRAALVEFNRAYALAPNGTVLFNIAETQYQLRDYAAALGSFEHFLAETAQNDPHRALAEANVRELRTRVGRLRITTVPPGAEISIDDRVIGKTPLEDPVIVGIGHVTLRGSAPGRIAAVRQVDIAAEDDIALTLELLPLLPAPRGDAQAPSAAAGTSLSINDRPSRAAFGDGAAWRAAGWVVTGVLGASAATFGVLALLASRDLKDARDKFPGQPATIQHESDRTVKLATVADSLTAATLVIGGITLYSTLTARGEGSSASVAAGPGSVALRLRY